MRTYRVMCCDICVYSMRFGWFVLGFSNCKNSIYSLSSCLTVRKKQSKESYFHVKYISIVQ